MLVHYGVSGALTFSTGTASGQELLEPFHSKLVQQQMEKVGISHLLLVLEQTIVGVI